MHKTNSRHRKRRYKTRAGGEETFVGRVMGEIAREKSVDADNFYIIDRHLVEAVLCLFLNTGQVSLHGKQQPSNSG